MIGKTISHYKILEKLGEGGMGVVYKAEDTKLGRIVALKFLRPELTRNKEAKIRFIHEAQAASALDHNNICTIYEIDETEDGQTFIVMSCYEGETLKDKIRRGPLKLEEALDMAVQIAQGLEKAHKKGIIHRDIKPANIFVIEDEILKILDFGVAKLAGQPKLTKTGSALGTAAYMSPEQAKGKEVNHRTDIWSLGVVLYEMLTAQLPFRGEYEQAVIYAILNEEPEPVTNVRNEELKKLIIKSLQKESGKRYQDMQELLAGLRSIQKKLETGSEIAISDRVNPLPSIAVLPFVNMSPDPENEYFSDGLAEELISALSKLEGLHVTARTSAFRFRGKDLDMREIGEQLNVGTVLEGSVRKSGNRLRITAQLIKAADGFHLWSEKYDRELGDVFAIQDDISLNIVDALKVRLLGKEREKLVKRYTDNMEAYDLYLKGRYFLNTLTEEGIRKSLDCFQEAIQKDPGYAPAYSGVASIHIALVVLQQFSSHEMMPKAKSELLKALEMDDSLAEAHAWLGSLSLQYEWDWPSAERELKRAIELKPNSPEAHQFYSDYLSITGRMGEAVSEAERARDLDPLSAITKSILIWLLFVSRQFDRAVVHAREALKAEPSLLIQMHYWRALRRSKMVGEAWTECKKFITLFISSEIAEAMEDNYAVSGFKGAMRTAAEKMAEQSKRRYVSPYMIATFFALAEDDDQTLHWLEKAYEQRDIYFYSIGVEPDWDRVRSNPRFTALLKKIGLGK
jgi:serine/threonine protein kinase